MKQKMNKVKSVPDALFGDVLDGFGKMLTKVCIDSAQVLTKCCWSAVELSGCKMITNLCQSVAENSNQVA